MGKEKRRKKGRRDVWDARCYLDTASCVTLSLDEECLLVARRERRAPFSCPCRLFVNQVYRPTDDFSRVEATCMFGGGIATRFNLAKNVYAKRQVGRFVDIMASNGECVLLLRFEWNGEKLALGYLAQVRGWDKEAVDEVLETIRRSECRRPDFARKKACLVLHAH